MLGPDGNEVGPDTIEGRYANYFQVGHNLVEFVLDFGQFYPGGAMARLHTRVVTSPAYACALVETMLESLRQYEEAFGPISKIGHDRGNS